MLLTDKYADKVYATLTCYDRMIIQGYIPRWSHAEGMTSYLNANGIRIFTYRPWHDKATGKTFLKFDQSKCLHYYFYFIDKKLGLCYLHVPTWAPFRLQFYMNGYNLLTHCIPYA